MCRASERDAIGEKAVERNLPLIYAADAGGGGAARARVLRCLIGSFGRVPTSCAGSMEMTRLKSLESASMRCSRLTTVKAIGFGVRY